MQHDPATQAILDLLKSDNPAVAEKFEKDIINSLAFSAIALKKDEKGQHDIAIMLLEYVIGLLYLERETVEYEPG